MFNVLKFFQELENFLFTLIFFFQELENFLFYSDFLFFQELENFRIIASKYHTP